eukprot:TRINITY_DN25450_c0_g1_i1.p1 TRINITY_DN25450_c0_g1~~TRINITY_DN25450_c0_g1_i1.p1  ORF type:complete len:322 (+),score=92.34 TRINITY_DN25450_c0_g1_i1:77-967(+)
MPVACAAPEDAAQQQQPDKRAVLRPLALLADPAALSRDGFQVLRTVLPAPLCTALRERLGRVAAGEFDTGSPPDKLSVQRTVHIINVWKCDALFRDIVCSPELGALAASAGGWKATRLLQDQVFLKPPGSGPVAFHRDEAYMGDGVVTVWLALDDSDEGVGPLEYVPGSHLWDGPVNCGFVPFLFDKKCRRQRLDAQWRQREGPDADPPATVAVHVSAGGGSVHTGRTWHGSGPNTSATRSRPGLGIHFVAADATLSEGDPRWRVFAKYATPGSSEMNPEHFPVTWTQAQADLCPL